MQIRTLENLPVKNQRVLLRLDLNVPLEGEKILDTTRIDAAIPTIQNVMQRGGQPIVMSHLGRPKGKRDLKYSLKLIQSYLEKKTVKKVIFAEDCIGENNLALSKNLQEGEFLLLENLRFHEGEESAEKEIGFVEKLAVLGDCYVNDAFATAHRKHSSTFYLPNYFSGKKAMGLLMEKELYYLGQTLKNPKRPFLAMIGGAKISSKIAVLRSLLDHVDQMIIGGALSYPFLFVQGYALKRLEETDTEEAKKILEKAKQKQIPIHLPEDFIVVNSKNQIAARTLDEGFQVNEEGKDIGQKTIQTFSHIIQNAQTIFWNGPFGVYEDPSFLKGTESLLKKLSLFTGESIIGGGDLVAAAHLCSISHFTHISTGGGASLEYIEKGELPAITALKDKVKI